MIEFEQKDFEFMELALLEAKKGFNLKEVPVGCVIVKDGQVIASAHNQVEQEKRASKHAELISIDRAARYVGDWRLVGCTLYSTLEPCIMCAGAILLSRLKKIVWGARDFRHGANGSFIDVFEKKHPIHNLEIQQGLLAERSSFLLKKFFKNRRLQ